MIIEEGRVSFIYLRLTLTESMSTCKVNIQSNWISQDSIDLINLVWLVKLYFFHLTHSYSLIRSIPPIFHSHIFAYIDCMAI